MSSAFQPRYRERDYPIGRFLADRAMALGLSRTELVRRLGYENLGKGHRALTDLLIAGTTAPLITKNLAAGLEIEQDLLDEVLLVTTRQQHDEARARFLAEEREYRDSFRPHLRVETERRIPQPIFVAALMTVERLRIVRLPAEAFIAGEDDRDTVIKRAILEHYESQHGQVPAFGAITGYTLVTIAGYSADFGLPFNVHGDRAGPIQVVERLGEAKLGVKRGDTRLTGLLKDTPIHLVTTAAEQ